MKITPVATGGMPGQNLGAVSTDRTSPERIAAAKSIAMGQSPMRMTESDTPVDAQVTRAQESIRRLKMKTNFSPDRSYDEVPVEVPETSSVISAEDEVVSEETKPLSPQFAALAKQRRALQVKERELIDREKALEASPTKDGGGEILAQLKSQPLRVLQDQGILTPEFYSSFTDFLVSGQSGVNPEIQSLKEEIKALREGVDKNFVDRDTAAEQQVLTEMQREAESLVREGDDYEMIRETRSVPKVIDLIKRTYKASGEVLDVSEALELVENQLFEDNLKIAQLKKIQAKFQSQQLPEEELQQQPRQQMRTLTNRDTALPPSLDRRTRAIMAMNGTLKRG